MRKFKWHLLAMMVLPSVLVVSCSQSEPSPTPEPTATATQTAVPPTEAPTAIPPTNTPEPTPTPNYPTPVAYWEDLVLFTDNGEEFAGLFADFANVGVDTSKVELFNCADIPYGVAILNVGSNDEYEALCLIDPKLVDDVDPDGQFFIFVLFDDAQGISPIAGQKYYGAADIRFWFWKFSGAGGYPETYTGGYLNETFSCFEMLRPREHPHGWFFPISKEMKDAAKLLSGFPSLWEVCP